MKLRHFDGFVVLAVLVLFLGGLAHGQSVAGGGGSIQAPYTNTVVMPDHAQHATQHSMGTEESLLGSGSVTEAHGEQPLWQFATAKVEEPLGDVARRYRASHVFNSRIIFEKQGQ